MAGFLATKWVVAVLGGVAIVGVAVVQLVPHHQHHARHFHHHHIQFDRANCVGQAAQSAPATIDPMIAVFDQVPVASCLTTSDRMEMLIEIAPDGRVTNVTHRPEKPTAESRCLAKAITALQFPAMASPLAIRKVFVR